MRNHVLALFVLVAVIALGARWLMPEPPAQSPTPSPVASPSKSPLMSPSLPAGEAYVAKPPQLIERGKGPALTKVTRVRMHTSQGVLDIEIYPQAAPNAAKRFLELASSGYYDGTPIFRVIPKFVAQFGINSKRKAWKDKNFNDDPSLYKLEPGTLAFAKAGPNTNSTQVFINYSDHTAMLTPHQFTTFGKVTGGYDHALQFASVGDPSIGLDQAKLWADTDEFLKTLPEKPDMIKKMEVLP